MIVIAIMFSGFGSVQKDVDSGGQGQVEDQAVGGSQVLGEVPPVCSQGSHVAGPDSQFRCFERIM